MTSEMIFVGTELLLGNITNTNGVFLAKECAALGLECYYQTIVGDNWDRLLDAVKMAKERSDVVILCGGLGPTDDDLTKEACAAACNRELFMDENIRSDIERFLVEHGYTVTDNNFKQALIPEGAKIIPNANGTAPGLIIEDGDKRLVLLPGPPNELIPMFKNEVKPYFEALTGGTIVSRMVKVCGIGESLAETMLKDLIEVQDNPTIATYAKTGEVHIRVTAKAEDEEKARKLIKPVVKEIKNRFSVNIYTTDENTTLEEAVVDLLKENDLNLTTAESCTAGMFAARIVNVPGASDMFKEGFITYSNKAKRKYLGVKKSTLEKCGAVSRETANEMARGVCDFAKADVSVAITGIAGPDGGSEEKPVGLVYIGVCVCGSTVVKEFRFSGNRQKIRESSVSAALVMLRECLLEYFSMVTFGDGKSKKKKK